MTWIETTATVAQALAVTAAGIAAVWGLTTWRREMTARRRAELAEQTLAMFYEARDVISWARFPGSFRDEGSSREKGTAETEHEIHYKDAMYVPVERLNQKSEFWGRFDAGRYPLMAVFGAKAAKPFDEVRKARNRVMLSARWLIRTYGEVDEDRPDRQQRREKWEGHIWGDGPDEEDELAKQVDDAVSAIESVCRPAITGNKKTSS
jgi:hypothetical protein